MQKRYWTDEERQIVREMFADHYTAEIAKKLNRGYSSISSEARKLGIKKSPAFKQMEKQKQSDRLQKDGAMYRFPKGNVSHNKGKKMPAHVYEKVKKSFFKKGHINHNALADFEETVHVDNRGVPVVKIKVPGNRRVIYKSVYVWEAHNGKKVPKGYNIVFKDGDTLNFTPDNLECISNAELLQRNTLHQWPKELQTIIKLNNKLKKATKDASRKINTGNAE